MKKVIEVLVNKISGRKYTLVFGIIGIVIGLFAIGYGWYDSWHTKVANIILPVGGLFLIYVGVKFIKEFRQYKIES